MDKDKSLELNNGMDHVDMADTVEREGSQQPGDEDFVSDSVSEYSSIISIQPTIKISRNVLLRSDSMLGESESGITQRSLNDCERLDQDQAGVYVKMLKNTRRSINFNNTDDQVSLQNSSLDETAFTSFLNITGLTENLPFSLDSIRGLDVGDNDEINKIQLTENENELDFSPTDGSDFNPEGISMSEEEYATEDEYYDDGIVKNKKKRIKRKIEKVSSSLENNTYKEVKGNDKDIINENTKRSWTRRNACFYCQNLVTNFTRHLLRHHSNELDVIKYKSINDEDPKIRKKKRQELTDIIRNKGNFLHNSKVCFDRDGAKTLLPNKIRDNKASSPSSFATCKNCLGTFKRATFFRHFKKCGIATKHGRVLSANSITMVANIKEASQELTSKILPHLRADEVALVVKNDRLILAYGTRLLKKKKERRSRKSLCSKMRDLASLLIIMRKRDETIITLSDALDPQKYEVFIESVKEMCGFNEDTGEVKIPSIPARILPAVLSCVDILYTQYIMGTESTAVKELLKKKLDDFKHLVTVNWQWEISSNAEKTKKRLHMTKENILPLEEDIKTMMETINKLEVTYARKLKIDCNVINYESLCIVTIAHIIMLDRKRAGDVAEAELSFYINRKHEEIPKEVINILTPAQKETVDTLDIFQIPGKRTRSVPILLTPRMRENIDLIIACRDDLDIPNTNPLLFARPMTQEPFDGGKCLNKIKKICQLKRPEMITSTGMRHHIATMSQIHSKSNDQYTEHLAGFLGHDLAVHSKNYRLPLQVLQKAVVGSQLMTYETQETNIDNPDILKEKRDSTNKNHKGESYFVPEDNPTISNMKENLETVNLEGSLIEGGLEDKIMGVKLVEHTEESNLEEENIESGNEYNENDFLTDIQVETRIIQQEPEKRSFYNGSDRDESILKKSKIKTRLLSKQLKDKPQKEKENSFSGTEGEETISIKPKSRRGQFKAKSIHAKEISLKLRSRSGKFQAIRKKAKEMSLRRTEGEETRGTKLRSRRGQFKAEPKKAKEMSLSSSEGDEASCTKLRPRRGQFKAKPKKSKEMSPNSTESESTILYSDDENKDERLTHKTVNSTKRKKINLTKTNVKTPKKAQLHTSYSSENEDHSDRSCEESKQNKTRKRPIVESDSDVAAPIRKRKKTHRFWSDQEVKAVNFHFKHYITKKINPGKAKCMEVLKKEAVLSSRTWMQLNTYVNNIYKKK